MPIVKVEIVREGSQSEQAGLAASLADSLAPLFDKEPERTWLQLNFIEPGHYAEGGGGPPPGVNPIFVSVLLAELPPLIRRQALAEDLANTVGQQTGRPAENVHVVFEPEAKGRLAFGGNLVQ